TLFDVPAELGQDARISGLIMDCGLVAGLSGAARWECPRLVERIPPRIPSEEEFLLRTPDVGTAGAFRPLPDHHPGSQPPTVCEAQPSRRLHSESTRRGHAPVGGVP